jgi:acyl-CoA thioesterase-2
VRDGRTYASRHVEVSQGGRVIFAMMASFHAPEPGRDRCRTMPDDVPDPEDLEADIPAMWDPLLEVRPVPDGAPAVPLAAPAVPLAAPPMRWWGRVTDPFPADVSLHYCALLYASDLRAGSAALIAAGLGDGLTPMRDGRGRSVGNFGSLDHALWFHRTPAVDEWFFCEVRPSTVTDSRGLVKGDMFDRAGRHLASFAQEMFLKEHDPSPFGETRDEAP